MSEELAVFDGNPAVTASRPSWPIWDDREVTALREILESGTWGTNGTRTTAFAAEYAERHDAEHGVMVTNGTIAIRVALEAVGVEPGDEVIVPPYTFVATASAVLQSNAVPVFADIESDSMCLDPNAVEEQITDRTSAVIPVHLGGRPADLEGLKDVCEPHDIAIVEDCAQAHGSWLDGEALGTIGDAGCFSFQSSKNINAGEGGLILTNDDDIYTQAWSIANVGRIPDGEWYEHAVLGSNYRVTEFQAAILQAQMTRMDEQLERRQRSADVLDDGLAGVDGIRPQSRHPKTTSRGYHLYPIQFDPDKLAGVDKATFMEAARAEGVPVGGGYNPLYSQELFTEIEERAPAVVALAETIPDYANVECPVTERLSKTGGWMAQTVLLGDDEYIEQIVAGYEKIVANAEQLVAEAA